MPSTSFGTTLVNLFAASGDQGYSSWNRFRFDRQQTFNPQRNPASNADRTQFSVAQLTRWLYPLSDEELRFRQRVKSLLAEPDFAPQEGLTMPAQAALSYARFKRVREELDLRVRDVVDRPARLATALELIATIDGTLFTVMSIHYCLCAGSLLRHGSNSPEIARYLDELDSLDTIGTFLVTELGYGNNVIALQTRADYDERSRELVISTPSAGARKFMPNTGLDGVPKLGVVMARLFVRGEDHGIFPVAVRLRAEEGACPGVSIAPLGDKPGYALDNAMTSFDEVRVPKHCLLLGNRSTLGDDGTFKSDIRSRRERFLMAVEQVQLGRLCLSAASATVAGASAYIAIKYGEQRRTFAPRQQDVPILEYRNHQRDVFSSLACAYASRLMVNYALKEYEGSATDAHDYSFRITSATKTYVSYATERAIRVCRERCGAAGLFEENRISVYASQCPGIVTAEGDNQIALIKIARQMLLRQGYAPFTKPLLLSGPLSDCERLVGLLCERERRLLKELRRSMAAARLMNRNLFAFWNENVNLAIETATAHASRLAAEPFWKQTQHFHCDHPVLELFRLFVYQEIAPHLGFFLAEKLVTAEEVKNHGRTVDNSCKTLRPVARELAEAFDVPNSVLRAPIASDDYIASYDARARRHVSQRPQPTHCPIGSGWRLAVSG